MNLEHIQAQFEKRRDADGLQVTLRPGATDEAIAAAEHRIGQKFPKQVRAFYSQHDGLVVVDPPFEILPVNSLSVDEQSRIHFATANGTDRIYFDCSCYNEAGQWDIIAGEPRYRITYTMGSFWANKMWKWIDRRRRFWVGLH